MIEEILYTSAPKGLKHGSRGFCTVVSTAGMAANLAERLESMSGYRHAFPLNDPKSTLNPVNCSHVTTRLAGRKLNILSRVADAGQDYSGRTNKLAHHLVIDDIHSLPSGPARLLDDANTIVSKWDGVVMTRPPRVLRNPGSPSSVKLTAWQAATGDSGWAGWVAEQLQSSQAPVYVIFAPGTETLALVREVLDLLPGPQRWDVTFSTYFTRLLAGTECQLRFVLDDTQEATALRNDARARVVDLTSSLPQATGGPLVDRAQGDIPLAQTAPVARPVSPVVGKTSDPTIKPYDATEFDDDGDVTASERSSETYRLRHRTPPTTPGRAPSALPRATFPKQDGKQSSKWMYLVIGLVLLCTVGGTGFTLRDEIGPFCKWIHMRLSSQADDEQLAQESHSPSPTATDNANSGEPLGEGGAQEEAPPQNADGPPHEMNNGSASNPEPNYRKHSPFEQLSELQTPNHESLNVALLTKGDEHLVYVDSPKDLSVEFDEKIIEFTKIGNSWKASIRSKEEYEVGHFSLKHSQMGEDGNGAFVLSWKWGEDVLTSREAMSDPASAYRFIRGETATLRATGKDEQVSGSIELTFGEPNPDQLKYLPADRNTNAAFNLSVPHGDKIVLGAKSNSVFIDSIKIDDLQISLPDQFSRVLTDKQIVLTLQEPSNESPRTRSWKLGIRRKPQSSEKVHLDDPKYLGMYIATLTPQESLIELHFEWLRAADANDEDSQLCSWAPIIVSLAGGPSDILFPRGPIFATCATGESLSVNSLTETRNVSVIPHSIDRDFVDLEVLAWQTAKPTERVSAIIPFSKYTEPSRGNARETSLAGENFFYFPLELPLQLAAERPEVVAVTLGTGTVRASWHLTDSEVDAVSYNHSVSLNLLKDIDTYGVSPSNPTPPKPTESKFWIDDNNKTFNLQEYLAAVDTFNSKFEENFLILNDEHRRLPDADLNWFNKTDTKKNMQTLFVKINNSWIDGLNASTSFVNGMPQDRSSILSKHEKRQEIDDAIRSMVANLKKLRAKYTTKPIDDHEDSFIRGKNGFAEIRKSLGDVQMSHCISINLRAGSDPGGSRRFYFVVPKPEESQ